MAPPPLRILIVDDEHLARDRVERLCGRIEGVEVVGQAASGAEALEKTTALAPDALLLDITMPGLDGVQTALTLADIHPTPAVIFVTAHDRFAVRAFDIAAVDYLLKPVELERLERALRRCRPSKAELPTPAPAKPPFATEFWAPRRGGLVRVPADTLTHVEAERDYVRLHAENDSFLIKSTLSNMVSELDPAVFIRTHRSFAVALGAVVSVSTSARGEVSLRLKSDSRVPVGRSFVQGVKRRLITRLDDPAS